MKGFIEIPANDRSYEFLINVSHIKIVVDQKDGSKIEYINGTVENLDLTYKQVKALMKNAIDGTGSNDSVYNNPDTPFIS